MAKLPPQASQPDKPNVHPLMRQASQAEDLLKRAAERTDFKEFQITEVEKWRGTVNALANSPDGQLFLKSMLQHSAFFGDIPLAQSNRMIESRIRATFYMSCVRPFLTPDLRSTIEP